MDGLADHHNVIVDVRISRTLVFYRSIHKIDIAGFIGDILKSDLVRNTTGDMCSLRKHYHHVLEILLNKHAPVTSKSVSQKAPCPWMTPETLQSKRRRRYLERVWRKHAHLWTDHAIPNSVIVAIDKWLKRNRIIILVQFQITLKIHANFGNA